MQEIFLRCGEEGEAKSASSGTGTKTWMDLAELLSRLLASWFNLAFVRV